MAIKPDVDMERQPNEIRNLRPEEQSNLSLFGRNPRPQAYVAPPKQLVSVQTMMKHTGSKEELHRVLTVTDKNS